MVIPGEVYDADGNIQRDAAGEPITEDVGFAGITSQTELQRQSPLEVPVLVGDALVRTGQVVLTLPQRMVDISKAASEISTDRKSTRLNSSHVATSYAVRCLTRERRS